MPFPIASLSKRTIRHDVAAAIGDFMPLQTSSGGTTTTEIIASLIGEPIASVQNRYFVLESGTNDGEWRIAQSFTPSSGTVTLRRAHTNAVASSVTVYQHEYSPANYTASINEAIRQLFPAVYKPVLHHTFTRTSGTQVTFPLPRGMDRVNRVFQDKRSSDVQRDYFDRSDSSTDPGSKWTASVGTWGISSEKLYSVSDANADIVLASANPYLKDGVIQAVIRGTLNSGSAYRSPALIFRYDDSSNYLVVRLLNAVCDLRKVDGGSESSLTTASVTTTDGTDYTIRIFFEGSWVRIYQDDVEIIHYELQGLNLKYLGYDESGTGTYGQLGVRWDKGGAPATAARVADYFAHSLVGIEERGDWEAPVGRRYLQVGVRNRGPALTEGRMIWLEGLAELTQVATDTFETLTTDSTATVEIQQTDPAYDALVQWAGYLVLDKEALASASTPERQARYRQLADAQLAKAWDARKRKAMPFAIRSYV